MNVKELHQTAEELFTKRSSLLLLWQEIADNFYPERADFTLTRSLGTDFAAHLSTSYPVMCRRDLGDQIGQMLHPTQKTWFHMAPTEDDRLTLSAKRWLERAEMIQRRAMYDRATMWVTASKQADHDFSAFGQSVKSVRVNKLGNGLLYRNWHLRDVAWMENEEGKVAGVFRRWKPTARQMEQLFGDKISDKVKQTLRQNKPLEEVECMHMVVEADMFEDDAGGKPWWSIYYDFQNEHVIEKVAVWNQEYNVARWQTVSGSQYAFSPATVAALPDGRLLQAMTYTLLEAGEKATNPPMIATMDAVKSDIQIYAGGTTWVDREYDERLGDALRPMALDKNGLPFGLDMVQDVRGMLVQAFYLNKLVMPQRTAEMTAYEVGQRIQEYIRSALPLFEPMEHECNGGDCELTFDILLRNGAFGSPHDMPKELQGAEIQFRFESPLHDAIEQQRGQKFLEMLQYVAQAIQLDQSVAGVPDAALALREVLMGVGVPAKWVRDEATVKRMVEDQQQMAQAQQQLGLMEQGAEVAAKTAAATRDRATAAATV